MPDRPRPAPIHHRGHPDLPPIDYPWTPVAEVGVLTEAGFHRLAGRFDDLDAQLRAVRAVGLADRVPVLAVGSNRSAAVLGAKFAGLGVSSVVAFEPVEVGQLGVGHSAHVSVRGYLAAAPCLDPERRTALTLTWLDELQLAALDRTEPNYERIVLSAEDFPVVGAARELGRFELYRSRWGLIAGADGHYLPLTAQAEVHRRLAGVPGLAELAELAGLPGGAGASSDSPAVVSALAQPAVRRRVREALLASGAVLSSGLTSTRSSG